MKRRNSYYLFLETVRTIVCVVLAAFLIWWLYQLLPMLITFD